MSEARNVTLTGTLPVNVDPVAEVDDEHDALLEAVWAARNGRGDIETFMGLFRAATVYVEAIPTEDGDRALQWVRHDGLTWLPVFTTPSSMVAFFVEAGRGDDQLDYGMLTGAELIDHCLPQLPRGTGMILDAASEHVLTLPPVTGIVGDELAITS